MGSAKMCGVLLGWSESSSFCSPSVPILVGGDYCPLTIGVETGEGRLHPFLNRGIPIPCSRTHTMTMANDEQRSAVLRVWEGERAIANKNHLRGVLVLEGLEPRSLTVVTLSIDANGILSVTTSRSGRASEATTVTLNNESMERLSREQIERHVQHTKRRRTADRRFLASCHTRLTLPPRYDNLVGSASKVGDFSTLSS